MPPQKEPLTGPLAGLKVIDLSRVLAGPYATQILGDHGADIIKVEPPAGDETRDWGPPYETDAAGHRLRSGYYNGLNRNKRAIALDLTKPAGRDIVLRLLTNADILVENFKAGTMEKWGIGPEMLRARFPRLIYARVTGFGSDGPLGGYPGYDAVAQVMTGLTSVNGSAASGPMRVGVPIIDMTTGLNLTIGILMALEARHRTGAGQMVEVALYDAGLSILHPHAANWFLSGKLPSLTGNAHPNIAPYELFETKTMPLFLGVGNDRQFVKAMEILGAAEIAKDARFKTNSDRLANRPALRTLLEPLLKAREAEALALALLDAGVPAGPQNDLGQVLNAPHTHHRAMVVAGEGYRGVGTPVKLSEPRLGAPRPPPLFAHDTDEILSEAGYGAAEIKALEAAGALVRERRT